MSPMKPIAICAITMFLSACEPTADERANLKAALPEDCKFYEVGSYGEFRDLVFIRCEGRVTNSANYTWTQSNGKTSHPVFAASFVIEGTTP